jgi:hypothetical protein
MAYHDDLIRHAIFLSELNISDEPKQVDLRRAVSAAYYGLFHLLRWRPRRTGNTQASEIDLADYSTMAALKTCSSRVSSRPLPVASAEIPIATDLKLVADIKLQQARHTADYDNSTVWSRTQVWEMIVQAEDAVAAWANVRENEMAQDFLLDLMGTR